jgi:hypothetical protein
MKRYRNFAFVMLLIISCCQRRAVSTSGINIDIITSAKEVEKYNNCPLDCSLEDIILIKIQNYGRDKILVPLSNSKVGKWYSPLNIGYLSLSDNRDTIYLGDFVTTCSFTNRFDTLFSNTGNYYCFPAYQLTYESPKFSFAELRFSVLTPNGEEIRINKVVKLSPDRKKLNMLKDTIPRNIKQFDRIKLGHKRVLIWGGIPPAGAESSATKK